jgi:chloride channel protein, CIC family
MAQSPDRPANRTTADRRSDPAQVPAQAGPAAEVPAPAGEADQAVQPGAPATPAAQQDVGTLLRSRSYLVLLVVAAILGVPVSAAAYGFLALVSYLQKELFTHLPHGLGLHPVPTWWPLPVLVAGGILTALAITRLPGHGGPSPSGGFKLHKPPTAAHLPGVLLAALATLCFGLVLGPEMPLIMLGGGLGALAVGFARRPVPEQGRAVIASAGSFAAVSTLLGSPILGAFLLMEASGLGGPMLGLVLVPGLLAAGVGSLIFIGLDSLTGLGTFSLAIPGLPGFSRPNLAEFGWAVVIGLAAALIGRGLYWVGQRVQVRARQRTMLILPTAAAAVAGLAIAFTTATGKPVSDVLFSGQNELGPLVDHAAAYTAGAVALLLVCKAIAYALSLGSFRGGPIFPAMFTGAAGGLLMSHLPGLPLVAAVAMGIGAMSAAMLKLPLTSVLLATLLISSDGLKVMPLVIVAVVVAYVANARIAPSPGSPAGGGAGEGGERKPEVG